MILPDDPFDPNTWPDPAAYEYRIYGDDRAQTWAIVDEEDYHWAIKWRWCWKRSKNKLYLRRAVGENQNGLRLRTFSLYLHIEIQKRKGITPFTAAHMLVDHRNGNSMDCRRRNLRWATHEMNSRNRFGNHGHEIIDEEPCQTLKPTSGITTELARQARTASA